MHRCVEKIPPAGALAALALLIASAAPARADVSDAIYRDAKAVIEELLSAEIAQSLVPQIVCMGARQEELASPTDCRGRIAEADAAAVCLQLDSRFVVARLGLLQSLPATVGALYSRRFGALGATISQEVVEVASDTFYRALRDDFAAIKKQLAAALDPSVRLGMEFADELAPPAGSTLAPLPAAAMASCVAQVRGKLRAGTMGAVSAVDRECARSSFEIARGPGGELALTKRDHPDRALPCELTNALRHSLEGRAEAAAAHGRRAAALVIAQALLAKAPVGPEARRAALLPVADEVTALLLALERAETAARPELWAGAVASFTTRVTAIVEHACRRPGASCTLAPPVPTAAAPLLTLLAEHQPLIARVAARLTALTSGGAVPLRVQLWLDELADALAGPGSVCDGLHVAACQLLHELPLRAGSQSLVWPAVRAASSGDLRAVAHLVVTALFGRDTAGARCERTTDDDRCRRDAFRRFADALVMYVLDAARGDTSEAVRTVFRQSAAEAIRFLAPYGGLDRDGAALGGLTLTLWPELALRASWSTSYVNDELGHYRTVASLPLLRARKIFWYTDRSYAALSLSLVDPLAPLAEIVLRADRDAFSGRPVTYSRGEQLLWNALAPRLEWTSALPWLSKHLTVSAGASLRWVTPAQRTLSADEVRYTYRGLGDAPWYDHVELSLSLSYVP